MKKLKFTIVCMLFSLGGIAQNVFTGDLTLATQSEIDDFAYTEVTGNLTITELATDTIVNLDGLNSLEILGGNLRISGNEALISLSGLDALTSVGGYLNVQDNDALTSINELNAVTAVGQYLRIFDNAVLPSLSGLESITSVGAFLDIRRNYGLIDLCALQSVLGPNEDQIDEEEYGVLANGYNPTYTEVQNMTSCSVTTTATLYAGSVVLTSQAEVDAYALTQTSITGSLRIIEAEPNDITNLENLSSLTSMGGELYVDSNDSLASFSGLDNLTHVGGNVFIYRNHGLTSLDGLGALTTVGDYFYVHTNDSLETLTGLESLASVDGFFRVRNNDALTSFNSLANLTSVGSSFWIWDNNELISFNGLGALASVGGNLAVTDNAALTSLDGLNSVTSVDGNLNVHTNAGLTDLCAVQSLVGGNSEGSIDEYEYSVYDNAYNPSYTEIQEDNTCFPLSLDVSIKDKGLSIYPNPASHFIQVSGLTNGDNYSMYNSMGEEVKKGEITNHQRIGVDDLSTGLYFLKVGSRVFEKIIIE